MTPLSARLSQDEIHETGLEVLSSELGPVGMVRFIQQFDKGSGDYTAERAQLRAGMTVGDVMTAIQKWRAEQERAPKPPPRRTRSRTISPDATPDELRGAGLEALRREFEPADFVRFLRRLIKPSSDLAAARAKLAAHLSADEIFEVLDNRPALEPERHQAI